MEQSNGSGKLAGRVAVVTGAARGIGRACAVALAREGADVVATDIAADIPGLGYHLASPEDLEETARLVGAEGRRCRALEADVGDMGRMREMAELAVGELGRLDILVANAGVNAPGVPLVEATDEQWQAVMDVNVIGKANAIRAVLPHMIEHGRGWIVAVASTFGRQGAANLAHYAASEWGVIGLVKSAALEVAPHHVTVNAVTPTAVKTGFGGGFGSREEYEAAEKALREVSALPIGILDPDNVADAVLFLVSERAGYITGAALDVAAGANARYTA